jgi:hypothetical protein
MKPVTPLRPPRTTALVVLPLAFLILSVVLLAYGLRDDAAQLGFWPLWGPAGLMVVVAYAVIYFALVQRAPESTVTWPLWIGLLAVALVIQVGGAYLTLLSAGSRGMPVPLSTEALCFARISLLSVPTILVVLWLLSRGLPLRPRLAGLLAGMGAGFTSEGIYRLQCGMSHPEHVLPWHTGAVLVMGILGLLASLWWESRTLQSWIHDRAPMTAR